MDRITRAKETLEHHQKRLAAAQERGADKKLLATLKRFVTDAKKELERAEKAGR